MLRYFLANDIYNEIIDYPTAIRGMNDQQIEALVIRLAEIASEIVQAKPGHTRSFNVSAAQFRRKMIKLGQKPYDDAILVPAISAINDALLMQEPVLQVVAANRLWDKPVRPEDFGVV